MNGKILNRRDFLKLSAMGSALSPFILTSPLGGNTSKHKFVFIFLAGGWDSALATDPIIGDKLSSGNYQDAYNSVTTHGVNGKNNLLVGQGLQPALEIFAGINTAFINGMYIEVPAHDLASKYVMTGQFTLSRTANLPSFVATMASIRGGFPSHIILGGALPLGDTATTAPPLSAVGLEGLSSELTPPGTGYNLTAGTMAAVNQAIKRANYKNIGQLGKPPAPVVEAWRNSEAAIAPLYESSFNESLAITDELKQRYNFSTSTEKAGKLASAFLVLSSGLSPYVTVELDGYDTHTSGLSVHTTQLTDFATPLATFVGDLQNTSDPDNPNESMMDHTTICITSEFVRTPKFNEQGGTDHWQSASAILLGKGIRDNAIAGATGNDAYALGWQNNAAVEFNEQSKIGPENLAATILSLFGHQAQADAIGSRLDDVLA